MITLKKNSLRYKDKDGNMQDSGVLFGHNETDITLTKSGIAADAKATGDELERLSGKIADQQTQINDLSDIAYIRVSCHNTQVPDGANMIVTVNEEIV